MTAGPGKFTEKVHVVGFPCPGVETTLARTLLFWVLIFVQRDIISFVVADVRQQDVLTERTSCRQKRIQLCPNI